MKAILLALCLFALTPCFAQTQPFVQYVSLNYQLTQDAVGYTSIADSASANPYEPVALKKGDTLIMVDYPFAGWGEGVRGGKHCFIRTSKLVLADKIPSGLKEFKSEEPSSYQPGSYHNIQTGPRGGRYYINGNGNKTYIKH